MKIDSHHYFWNYQPGQFKSSEHSNVDVLKTDYLPHDALVPMVNHGFQGCIAQPFYYTDEENQKLLDFEQQNECVLGIVAWIDLTNPNIGQRVNYYANKRVVGFCDPFSRHSASDWAMKKEVLRGLQMIGEYKFPFEIQASAGQFADIVNMIHSFPDQVFIINQLGYLPETIEHIPAWQVFIKHLSTLPKVYFKLHGFYTLNSHSNLSTPQKFDLARFLIDTLPLERLLFASDWPVLHLESNFKQFYNQFQGLLEEYEIPSEEQALIFGLNASKIYLNHKINKLQSTVE